MGCSQSNEYNLLDSVSLMDLPNPHKKYKCSNNIKSTGFQLIHKLTMLTRKNPDAFDILIDYLNENPSTINNINDEGWTALMLAVRNSNIDSSEKTVQMLLENGADPNIQDNTGWTSLMMAVRYSNTDSSEKTVQMLLENGADTNIKNNAGYISLMMAVR